MRHALVPRPVSAALLIITSKGLCVRVAAKVDTPQLTQCVLLALHLVRPAQQPRQHVYRVFKAPRHLCFYQGTTAWLLAQPKPTPIAPHLLVLLVSHRVILAVLRQLAYLVSLATTYFQTAVLKHVLWATSEYPQPVKSARLAAERARTPRAPAPPAWRTTICWPPRASASRRARAACSQTPQRGPAWAALPRARPAR